MGIYDTVCAVSTAMSGSAINIIRISGNDAIPKVNGIFKGADLRKKKGNTVTHGWILDSEGNILDEVLVSLFRSPKSYTREDLVEINTHGGSYVTSKVLERVMETGIRMAEPGEFTKRAFLNGRMDLSEAEAVMDTINAQTKQALFLSEAALSGGIKELISSLRKEIMDVLLHITVNIDYPEYTDELQVTNDLLLEKCTYLIDRISDIIRKAESMRVYREGVKTVILGKPNVGKSSLLNCLLGEDKAIVTPISGTTRDTVEGDINIDGILLHLTDTAGIRETADIIEKIGIEKSRKKLEEAELVLLVLDQSEGLTDEDRRLLGLTEGRNRIVLMNKSDLREDVLPAIDGSISISAETGDGITELRKRIKDMFIREELDTASLSPISSSRHIAILKRSLFSLSSALAGARNGDFIDMVEIDLREAFQSLGEITGETGNSILIDELFRKFCLGK